MRALLVLVVVAGVAGCDDDKDKFALPSSLPPPKPGLAIKDVHVPTKGLAAIGTEGESGWRISVATDAVDCDKLQAAYPERPKASGKVVDFWLMQPLESDGSFGRWSFRSAFMSDDQGERGLTTRGAQLDDLVATPSEVTIKGLELASQDRNGDMIAYTGPLTAKSCGRVKRSEEDRHQKELALTIAGKPFEVHGASLIPQGDQVFLRLTRAPHSCSSVFTEGYDFYLDVALKGDPPKVQFAALLGDIFPGDPSGSKGKESMVLEVDGPLSGDGEAAITIEGTLDVGGYKTSLKGKLSARRCTLM